MKNELPNLTKQERRELRRQGKMDAEQQKTRNRLIKRIALWSFVALGVGGVILGMVKLGGSSQSSQPALLADTIIASDQMKGNKNAKTVLVEYSDFQCPACASYHPLIKELMNEFGDRMQFAYRHFPLKQIHANAELAARAAEAAGKQGKFWEMHDLIFEKQNEWSNLRNAKEAFVRHAESLNLDVEQFKQGLDSREIKEKVESDYQSGIRSGVNATPTFFLNGEKLQNPRSYEDFRNIIQQNLNPNE